MGLLFSSSIVNETREFFLANERISCDKNCSDKWKGTSGNCSRKFRRSEKLGKYEKKPALGQC